MRRLVIFILLLAAGSAGARGQVSPDRCIFVNGATPAFCDTFNSIHKGGRAGDLDPLYWTFYRISSNVNPTQGGLLTFYPTTVQFCDVLRDNVFPDNDSFICGQQFGEPNYWLTSLNDAGAFAWLGSRALQPFDFTNRTGTIVWSVDAKTAGSHTWWPEVWITDEPAPAAHESSGAGRGVMPRNGIGFHFGGTACISGSPAGTTPTDTTISTGGIETVTIVRNYQESTLNYAADQDFCYTVQSDHANHFEIRISQSRLELWASDLTPDDGAGTLGPNFRRILSADNLNLPFTRGYIYFQQVQYNAAKEGVSPMQTYHWHGVGFDGPVHPLQRVYQVPDALSPSPDGGLNLGYMLTNGGLAFQLDNVDATNAANAWLTFNFEYADLPTTAQFQYRLNGHAWKTFSDPKGTDGYGFGGAVIPVDVADLVAGTNMLEVLPVNVDAVIANIDLLVDPVSSVTPPQAPPTISNLRVSGITPNSATIGWMTDRPTNGQVQYGTSMAYGLTSSLLAALVTDHSVPLSGLSSNTSYHYAVTSLDASGNAVTSPDQTFTTAAPPPPPSATLLGDTAIESSLDTNPPGMAEAFEYTATATGVARTLNIYLDRTSASQTIVVGLYAHNSQTGSPGTLIAQGTIASPIAGGWNSLSIPPVAINANTVYWIAVLGLGGTGQVQFRDRSTGTRNQTSAESNLTNLPATWTPGAVYFNAPMSAFATQ